MCRPRELSLKSVLSFSLVLTVMTKCVQIVQTADIKIQTSPVTNWGSWDTMQTCPSGSHVTSFRLCEQEYQGAFKDDNAMTGIELQCNDANGTVVGTSGSVACEWSPWADAPPRQCYCGVQMKVDKPFFTMDHVATVNCKLQSYPDGTWISAMDGHDWGTWGEQVGCPDGYCISGIATQYDTGSWSSSDSTAVNNIQLQCSPL